LTQQELDIFLNAVTVVGAAMAVFNWLRFKSRGASAYLLAFGFLLLAGIAQLYRAHASQMVVESSIALLFLVLIADFAARAGKSPPGGGKKR